jgi:hypothetical protein
MIFWTPPALMTAASAFPNFLGTVSQCLGRTTVIVSSCFGGFGIEEWTEEAV